MLKWGSDCRRRALLPVRLHDGQSQRRRPAHWLVGRRDDARALRQPVHNGRRAVEQLAQAVDDELHGITAASSDGLQELFQHRLCNVIAEDGHRISISSESCQQAELAECRGRDVIAITTEHPSLGKRLQARDSIHHNDPPLRRSRPPDTPRQSHGRSLAPLAAVTPAYGGQNPVSTVYAR